MLNTKVSEKGDVLGINRVENDGQKGIQKYPFEINKKIGIKYL